MTLTRSLLSRAEEEERDAVPDAVRKRWLGHGRKVGLKADVHLLAFVLAPFVQGALTTAQAPDCDLLAGEVLSDEEEADGEDGEQDAEGEEGEEGAALSRGIREVLKEVRWSVPDGFTVALSLIHI